MATLQERIDRFREGLPNAILDNEDGVFEVDQAALEEIGTKERAFWNKLTEEERVEARAQFPGLWSEQQNAQTEERGFGMTAPEQAPPDLYDPRMDQWTFTNPVPATEEGPHLRDPKNAQLRARLLEGHTKFGPKSMEAYQQVHADHRKRFGHGLPVEEEGA